MYNHKNIEKKWQNYWEDNKTFKVENDFSKPKYYTLDMFPFPSWAWLHVGHPEWMTANDIVARYKTTKWFNVLHPMWWDAFWLPAENYAIKTGTHPKITTQENINNFRKQIKAIWFSYDWDREIDTTDPKYYKWTQWIFLKLFENGLAYEQDLPINYCPSCKTWLANEEVLNNFTCERCETKVEKKQIRQWVLAITKYADRLLNDVDKLDWPEWIKDMQRNWIGKSAGCEFEMKVAYEEYKSISVYTTRIDTVFGMTYAVLAPDHPHINDFIEPEHSKACLKYIHNASKKSDQDRTQDDKEKTWIFTGTFIINPFNWKQVPLWIWDYVLGNYGTWAVMAVPAHDIRDFEFAKKYDLEIIESVSWWDITESAYTNLWVLINSWNFDWLKSKEAQSKLIDFAEKNNFWTKKINYKLRDWLFSRQRYWWDPIPLVHCDKCGIVAEKEENLPILLPETDNFKPSGDGTSPLSKIDSFINCKCPKCDWPWKRETNTMPQWWWSCWYYLRYMDSNNTEKLVDPEVEKYWGQVDSYVGWAEHAVLHLLYARFWHKFLFDIWVVSFDEPFYRLRNQWLIQAHVFDTQNWQSIHMDLVQEKDWKYYHKETGEELEKKIGKMSKSLWNVINPDHIVDEYGADSLRLYEMYLSDFKDAAPWNTTSIIWVRRFLEKAERLFWTEAKLSTDEDNNTMKLIHKTIKKIEEDIENYKFNTAIASLMILVNNWLPKDSKLQSEWKNIFIRILHPFAPHLAEELWERIWKTESVFKSSWPKYDKKMVVDDTIKIAVQVLGKVRWTIEINKWEDKDSVLKKAKNNLDVAKWLEWKNLIKEIYVPGKIVNLVIN
jgi:leucyl-tRNA synthetase